MPYPGSASVRYNWLYRSPARDTPRRRGAPGAARAASASLYAEHERRLAPDLVDAIARRRAVPAVRSCGRRRRRGAAGRAGRIRRGAGPGDASAAWCVAIAATSGLLLALSARRHAAARSCSPAGHRSSAGCSRRAAAPARGDGFRVSGRWPFASGSSHCDWLMGGCVGHRPARSGCVPGGMPDVRLMLAPADEVVIHDTWHVRRAARHREPMTSSSSSCWIPRELTGIGVHRPAGAAGCRSTLSRSSVCSPSRSPRSRSASPAARSTSLVVLASEKTPTGSRRRLAERATVQAEVARGRGVAACRPRVPPRRGRRGPGRSPASTARSRCRERLSLRLAATHARERRRARRRGRLPARAAAVRSTSQARCSGDSATPTSPRSTCSWRRRRGSSAGDCCSGSRLTSASCSSRRAHLAGSVRA